ncbi:hypothetical protein BDV59DRAFT_203800 [Aspergillus ambiguus]|uniref:uncharacterized protein n=1 Tax=Aspergillus ambiguus TaxID=176160 RepID=UPI003CCE19E5
MPSQIMKSAGLDPKQDANVCFSGDGQIRDDKEGTCLYSNDIPQCCGEFTLSPGTDSADNVFFNCHNL